MHRTLFLALLAVAFAGCTQSSYENEALPPDADDTSMPADGFAPQEGRQDTGDEHVSFVGELSTGCPADERFCIYLTATNEGSSTLYVRTSQEGAFTESMKQRDSSVTKSEPMFYTQEWTVAALAPGRPGDLRQLGRPPLGRRCPGIPGRPRGQLHLERPLPVLRT